MHQWFYERENVIELAEFLVDTEQISNMRDLLDYFKDPSRFTDVWIIYRTEIIGDESLYESRNIIQPIILNL